MRALVGIKSMKVAGTACLTTEIKMATFRKAVADLRCFSVSRDFRHLGLIRRQSMDPCFARAIHGLPSTCAIHGLRNHACH